MGAWAPALIILLRILQGLAVAGEQSSATSMVLEHSTDKTRGFWSSFTLGGTQLGFVLATAVFLPLAAWSIASRRGAWDELLAATIATTAIAAPLVRVR